MSQGRPRNFDIEDAFVKAEQCFCELGYEGASLSKLTKAMGINSPSLYSAFGDKESLFIAILDRHVAPSVEFMNSVLDDPNHNTLEAFVALINIIVDCQLNSAEKHGCLIANSSIYLGEQYPKISQKLQEINDIQEALFIKRLESGIQARDIAQTVDSQKVARFLIALIRGLSIQTRSQKDPQLVRDIGDQAVAYLNQSLKI